MHVPTLTVAVCTMDRPGPLLDVLRALASQETGFAWEALVVDEGRTALDPGPLDEALAGAAPLRVLRKGGGDRAGLYGSRAVAAREARAPLVLFLDDDAPPRAGYLSRLVGLAASLPGHAGFGGVDRRSLPESPSRAAMAYARLFGVAGRGPGRLGRTGFNHGQMAWRSTTRAFESEFLHGCNMAFRAEALRGLPELPWLSGHSCCEDLVLSTHARRLGPLLVDPALSVDHMCAPGGRGTNADRLSAILGNHARFQAWRSPGSGRAAFAWSLLGLFAKDVAFAASRRGLAPAAVVSGYSAAAPAALSALAARGRAGAQAASASPSS